MNHYFSYGKLCENVSRYTDTKIARWSGIRNDWIKPRTQISQLSNENVFEVVTQPKSQKDNKLICVGSAVLQLSKLLLLKFVYFLEEHLIEGSFKILYLGEFNKHLSNSFLMWLFQIRIQSFWPSRERANSPLISKKISTKLGNLPFIISWSLLSSNLGNDLRQIGLYSINGFNRKENQVFKKNYFESALICFKDSWNLNSCVRQALIWLWPQSLTSWLN